MSVKIRLQRFGKRNQSFYHIVAADARAPRDGKFIEQLGIYNPRTNPATIELDTDKALKWLDKGAQASDTCRAILAYRGVMHRKHLNDGVRKNAITQEEADSRHQAWLVQKNLAISQKAQNMINKRKDEMKHRLAEESKVRDKIAEKVLAKRMAESEAIEAVAKKAAAESAEATAEAIGGSTAAESAAEAPATDEVAATPEATAPSEPEAGAEASPAGEKPEQDDQAEGKSDADGGGEKTS